MPPVIEVHRALVERGGRVLCQELDWRLPDPGAYLLLGPNGSGKSVLSRMLAGRLRPREGNVLLDGRPIYGPLGARADCWLAEAHQAWGLDEPLLDYLEQELLRAGGRPGGIGAVWPLLEARLGGKRRRLAQLSHGQALLVHFALAACVPQRVVILDGHLSYLDPALGGAAAQLLHAAPPGSERFLLLTSARLVDHGFSWRAIFAVDGTLPIIPVELDWDCGGGTSFRFERRLIAYPDGALGPAWRLVSGSSFAVLGQTDAGGWQIKLLGTVEQFLEELRNQGIGLSRLEWETQS